MGEIHAIGRGASRAEVAGLAGPRQCWAALVGEAGPPGRRGWWRCWIGVAPDPAGGWRWHPRAWGGAMQGGGDDRERARRTDLLWGLAGSDNGGAKGGATSLPDLPWRLGPGLGREEDT